MAYEITVNKLHEILGQIKDAGEGKMLVVVRTEGAAPMPIVGVLNAGVGTRERYGAYIMSEEECKTAPDDTPQVVCLEIPQMVPVTWLSRELAARMETS